MNKNPLIDWLALAHQDAGIRYGLNERSLRNSIVMAKKHEVPPYQPEKPTQIPPEEPETPGWPVKGPEIKPNEEPVTPPTPPPQEIPVPSENGEIKFREV